MEITSHLFFLIFIPLIIIIFAFLLYRIRVAALNESLKMLNDTNSLLKSEILAERAHAEEFKKDILFLEKHNTQLRTDLDHVNQRLNEELGSEEKRIQKFENLANKVLRSQSVAFCEQQVKGMNDILSPLSDKIKQFEAKVDATHLDSLKRHVSLKEQISFLSKQSQQVSEDANNLAKALKGDYKKQGNWGELILEMILEKSGLEKNREYFTQESFKGQNGRTQRPDVVIHLPDNKRLIIDSKVSLVSYDAMCAAETSEEAERHQKNHAQAIKKHIELLSAKNYHDLYKIESPDFVLMFVPIDTAFSAALLYDSSIYEYGFKKNIIIVTPATLLATLKTVETLWRNDKQNRFALQIADEAGKMYDKFVGFIEDMDKMGAQINTVQKTYDLSMRKLSRGSGNVIRKAELVKSLGAKANKSIPDSIIHAAKL